MCIAELYCRAMELRDDRDGDLADSLDARLAQLWRLLGRPRAGQLSRTATSVLATLRDAGPQRVTALAAGEAVAQPTMTTLVGRLERDGLVERGADPDDARAVRVRITGEGLERLAERRAVRVAALADRLAALGADDRAVLEAALPALDKLIEGTPE
jgi:DNA-binding MarR family transcriptional regulator